MKTDVCIVGGGLVGLTAALAFSRQGREVCLLESSNLQQPAPKQLDARSLALSHSSIQILSKLGVWAELQAEAAAIRHIHVSSAGHFGVTRLHARDLDLEAMGQVVEYHVLARHLLEQAQRDGHIRIVSPASFTSLQPLSSAIEVTCQLEQAVNQIEAAVLLVADGAGSSAREALGIGASVQDFAQHALIANVQIGHDGEGVAYERFTDEGPLALLPLTDRRYALVWTNPPERTQRLLDMSPQEFLSALHKRFGYRLGRFSAVGERVAFPLRLTRADRLVSGRCVVIGNAANTLHPVAGQGLNLAMRDIATLYDLLQGRDLDHEYFPAQLQSYPELRKRDQNLAVGLSSSLVQLFSNRLPLLNHARAGALAALDLCPPAKHEFSWVGMGFGATASSLMRGEG